MIAKGFLIKPDKEDGDTDFNGRIVQFKLRVTLIDNVTSIDHEF